MAACFEGEFWFARVSHSTNTKKTNPDLLMFATPLTFRLSIMMQFSKISMVREAEVTYRSQTSGDGPIVYQGTCFGKAGEIIVRRDCLLGTLREKPRGDPALYPNASEANLKISCGWKKIFETRML